MGNQRYRPVRRLAEGGMGTVELVVRQEGAFHRAYALKRLRPEFRRDPRFVDMFQREARIAGLLNHPNIVSVLDVGQDAAGPFLIMDFVEGLTLSELIDEASRSGRTTPLQIVLRILIDVARALSSAHQARDPQGAHLALVHRDVSPQNILVAFDGTSRLSDFGIAKALIEGHERTATGVFKGKLAYFAPEQLRFKPATPKTDLYALGVVMYEALAGRRMYAGCDAEETARRILESPPPDIFDARQDVAPELVELFYLLVAKEPEERPASARVVLEALESILARELQHAPLMSVQRYIPSLMPERVDEVSALIAEATRISAERTRPRRRGYVLSAALALCFASIAWAWTSRPTLPPRGTFVKALPAPAPSPAVPPAAPVLVSDLPAGPAVPSMDMHAETARSRNRRPRPRSAAMAPAEIMRVPSRTPGQRQERGDDFMPWSN